MSRPDTLAGLRGDWKKLAREAVAAGWMATRRKDGVLLQSPDGQTQTVVHTSQSDVRALRNFKAALRRGGFTHTRNKPN